jgi:hypothetical protein
MKILKLGRDGFGKLCKNATIKKFSDAFLPDERTY